MSFDSIIGNNDIKELLNKNVISDNILHSYMFSGIDGIGKSLFAKEFAKMILCSSDEKPCNKCKSCLEFENGNNPDFMIIEKDYDIDKKKEKNLIGIDQIRYMNQKISEKPITSNRKVYIINNSDCMTKEAQNALLKTLEEPPQYATIILITSNESKLLNTIKSRCIKMSFNKISNEEIIKYLQIHDIDIDVNMVSSFDGSLGKAFKISENKEEYLGVKKIIDEIDKVDLVYILNNSDILYKNKDIIFDLLEYINILLLNSKQLKKINCIKYVEEARNRLTSNSNYDMTIDNLLIKIWEEVNEEYNRC